MKKGGKVAHASGCKGGKCRGRCMKNNKVFNDFLGKAKQKNVEMTIGAARQGKSTANVQSMYEFWKSYDPPKADGLWENYQKKKAEHLAEAAVTKPELKMYLRSNQLPQLPKPDNRNLWETFGRLLGMAYASGDADFFALLEGFHRGRLNELEGRRALGGPKK